MSAYQVNKDTIDLIVSAALDGIGSPHERGLAVYLPEDTLPFAAPDLHGEVRPTADGTYTYLQIGDQTADALGRELITQNIRSLAARYRDVAEALDRHGWSGDANPMVGYWPDEYRFRRVLIGRHELAKPTDVLGAIQCYTYQSSETGDLSRRPAGIIIGAIRDKVISRISTSWEWSRAEAEEKRNATNKEDAQ